jgi:Zn-dependent protease with chaperone function
VRSAGDRALAVLVVGLVAIGLAVGLPSATADQAVALDGYAEWRRGGDLIVDGQRVRADARTAWRGGVSRVEAVPLGHEVRVRGVRQADGAVLARRLDVRPNAEAWLERDVRRGTATLEGLWLGNGRAFETDENGRTIVLGDIQREGPAVDRARGLVRRLAPPYVDPSSLRVYVIDNRDWNALAMASGTIWVFRGVVEDFDEHEQAIVIGHELAHFTHEHPRRQMRRNLWGQIGALAALLAVETIDHRGARAAARLGSLLGFTAWMNGYGRNLEDQADRVGLRYAYEAGFDVTRAPAVWERFLRRYGEHDRVTAFFADHSRASARRRNLEMEIALNYERR